jgi:hypothetical protein
MGSGMPGISIPFMFLSFRIMHAKGSMARSKIGQDRGSPCLIPLRILKGSLRTPFMATHVFAFLYRALSVLMKVSGRLKAFRASQR